MSRGYIPGKNTEGYSDPTAAEAMRSIQRSIQGLQSRRAGESFESLIESSLKWYELHGYASIEKTPEPMRPLRRPNRQGQFLACYVKSAQPDFKGTLAGGRSVVFEAKHTDSDRIEYSCLTDEQIEKLRVHHALGAVCFVLVEFGLQDYFRIPWEIWSAMKEIYGHKHMKRSECEPYRVKYTSGVLKLLEGIKL